MFLFQFHVTLKKKNHNPKSAEDNIRTKIPLDIMNTCIPLGKLKYCTYIHTCTQVMLIYMLLLIFHLLIWVWDGCLVNILFKFLFCALLFWCPIPWIQTFVKRFCDGYNMDNQSGKSDNLSFDTCDRVMNKTHSMVSAEVDMPNPSP